MMSARIGLLGLVVMTGVGGAGCTEPNPLSCADGYCSDQTHPFCDTDGSIGGTPNLCVAIACTPLAFQSCRGDAALTCSADGTNYDTTNCAFGCSADAGGCKPCTPGTAGCASHIIPKYLPTVCDQPAAMASLSVDASMTLDTNVDASCNGGVVTQTSGPAICVLRYGTITIPANKTLTVTGKRALALVADDALTIDGVLDASAKGSVSGPGGGTIKSGTAGSLPNGSGGPGFRTHGGSGGNASADGGGPAGGPSEDPTLRVELVGGPQVDFSAFTAAAPGGGGGAVTIISCRARSSLVGLVNVGGGGGAPSTVILASAGGGAGGYLVIQGVTVDVAGQAYANGGGGGAGYMGGAGADGTLSAVVPAAGGLPVADPNLPGAGGAGGVGTKLPGNGLKAGANLASAGAGGGSTGYLQTYSSGSASISPSASSPPFGANGVLLTR